MTDSLPQPWYHDDHVTFFLGDAQKVLSVMPPGSVDCIVTSLPYWRLREYEHPAQLGQEATPAAYAERLQALFSAARRVLADHGALERKTVLIDIWEDYHRTGLARSNMTRRA